MHSENHPHPRVLASDVGLALPQLDVRIPQLQDASAVDAVLAQKERPHFFSVYLQQKKICDLLVQCCGQNDEVVFSLGSVDGRSPEGDVQLCVIARFTPTIPKLASAAEFKPRQTNK